MTFAITVLILVALFAYATGKLVESQPASRIIQGIIALVGGILILLGGSPLV